MSQTRELRSILATDCGSTTTKAILILKQEDGYRLVVRGEAPTTVEAPFEDVTRGVLNAVGEVEELSGRKILDGETIISPERDGEGVDVYVSTSSAGGGLQMMVAGVVKQMTGESAERAALGAGAIVMDVLATNDGRRPHERIERIRRLRPDMILLSGGTDGGTVDKVVELAELISAARPQARLGAQYQLPIIYAGNKDARDNITKLLAQKSALSIVENLRPTLERENLKPARDAIHELFMEHVMAHAPGYKKLMKWTEVPIMPTPGAVGLIMQTIAHLEHRDADSDNDLADDPSIKACASTRHSGRWRFRSADHRRRQAGLRTRSATLPTQLHRVYRLRRRERSSCKFQIHQRHAVHVRLHLDRAQSTERGERQRIRRARGMVVGCCRWLGTVFVRRRCRQR